MDSLVFKNISVSFGENLILDDISFDLPKGEIMAIVGKSGSGKSTILNLIGGVFDPSKGELRYLNQDIYSFVKGYIPQNLGLLPWKKVYDNIFLANTINPKFEINRQEADEIIVELGVADLLNRYPMELSGGQRQRVALARLFVSYPDIFLMDEPFSALDTFTAETSLNLFLKMWKKRKTTTIVTTHNLHEAVRLGKKIMIISSTPGKVIKIIQNPLLEKGAERGEKEIFDFVNNIKGYMAEESDQVLSNQNGE